MESVDLGLTLRDDHLLWKAGLFDYFNCDRYWRFIFIFLFLKGYHIAEKEWAVIWIISKKKIIPNFRNFTVGNAFPE